jgi:hypothetical protein
VSRGLLEFASPVLNACAKRHAAELSPQATRVGEALPDFVDGAAANLRAGHSVGGELTAVAAVRVSMRQLIASSSRTSSKELVLCPTAPGGAQSRT